MLVLSLKLGEGVQVGEMTIRFLKYSGKRKVKLTFEGPREIAVLRIGAKDEEPTLAADQKEE
jgi:sRNA-binding carbon storage regulator CsrA